ncbi:MAG: geranylgeranylglyceryl/heptaprenylglyceryl phosphate synthase [Bacteroidota bacterium]|nr:geranylgeranylglyceryl/heptaprenylglyceryl phosphate synthase [Bacteroidota bacterium]
MHLYNKIKSKSDSNTKQFAVLIDPDSYSENSLKEVVSISEKSLVDYFFVGGSLLTTTKFHETVAFIKSNSSIPAIIFPGSSIQIDYSADAILFLSLISGRNPDLLIGQHVQAAPLLKASSLEVISTGYILIDSGRSTTASYISNTTPIPHDKDDIAVCTALAGQYLGQKLIYLDGGSGADNAISTSMISSIKNAIDIPIIIGGGINTAKAAKKASLAGADIVVVGNTIEKNPSVIKEISEAIHSI